MKKQRISWVLSLTLMGLVVVAMGCKSKDNAPPQITLLGDQTMTIALGSVFTDPGATSIDEVDGDITSEIVVTGTVNTNAVGTYIIEYSSTDEAGHAAGINRMVNVIITRDAVLGNYTTTTTCTNYPYNSVASSTTFQAGSSSDHFIINQFYFNGGTLSCTISGSSVTVDGGQAPNPILDGVTGSGTFNASGKSLTMNYTFQPNGGSPTSCSVTYTRP